MSICTLVLTDDIIVIGIIIIIGIAPVVFLMKHKCAIYCFAFKIPKSKSLPMLALNFKFY